MYGAHLTSQSTPRLRNLLWAAMKLKAGNWSTIESTMECRIADMIPTIQIHPQWMIGNQAASCQDNLILTLCLTQSVPNFFQIFWPHDLGRESERFMTVHDRLSLLMLIGILKRKYCLRGTFPKYAPSKFSKYHIGVSLNGGTPKTPQNDHFFCRKKHR